MEYEFYIKGHIDIAWEDWFEDFSLNHLPDGNTRLQGQVADQPMLQSILLQFSKLGLTLLKVEKIKERSIKMDEIHVVLGASGGVGHAVASRLAKQGKPVRAVNRSGRIPGLPDGVQLSPADVLDVEEAINACEGASVVYHCVHPKEDYSQLPRMTENIVAGAQASGARLIMAASVYPYGIVDRPMTENMPYKPEAPSGEFHAQAADIVMKAHEDGRVQASIGRASNYFGPFAPRLWPGIDFRQAVAGEKMQIIGKTQPLHTYTYVYDFADGLITLGKNDRALGEVWHLPSAETISTQEFLDLIYKEAGTEPDVQIGPKLVLQIMGI
ncbi:MAG: NAD-dependent epimerase/dehydratase family protein, partial [Anaerolineales bacterium]|nr:NAD-dependent epimerase/dehydratase family protein [Anaerolineales bacterium]